MRTFKGVPTGFTLIELLVVIAIIGILASIILASLSTAKSKGSNAKIEETLGNARSQAELYTGATTAVNAGACATGSATLFGTGNNGLGTLLNSLGLTFSTTNSYCYYAGGSLPSAGAKWVVAIQTTGGYWCSDSNGDSRGSNAAGTPYASISGTGATAAADTTTEQCN